MVVQKTANSGAHSVSVRDASQAKTPWEKKAGLARFAAKTVIVGSIVAGTLFGSLLTPDRMPSRFQVQDRKPAITAVMERAAASLSPKPAWAQAQISEQEAMALLKSRVDRKESFGYRLRKASDPNEIPDMQKLLREAGGQALICDMYTRPTENLITVTLGTKSNMKIIDDKGVFSINLALDFLKTKVDPETGSVWSKDAKFAILENKPGAIPIVVVADKGEDRLLVITMERVNGDQIGTGIRQIALGFKISDSFALYSIASPQVKDLGAVFFYDNKAQMGTGLLFGNTEGEKAYRGNVAYFPLKGYEWNATQIETSVASWQNESVFVMGDPTWIGGSVPKGNGEVAIAFDVYLTQNGNPKMASK